MKNYTILYAEDVPHYASVTIEAKNDQAAIDLTKKHDFGSEALEAEWGNPVCKRIVYIEDDEGKVILSDSPLDNYRLQNLDVPIKDGYGIAVGHDDGDTYDIVLKQGDTTLATLVAPEGQVAPLAHAGNCHKVLREALEAAEKAIEEATDIMLFEDGKPVTFLESSEIERAYFALVSTMVQVSEALEKTGSQ